MSLKRFKRRTGEPIENVCVHPEDKRIDASTMGHPGRWICGECRHKNWEEA